jgi:muramidase (phage lysozyme)
MLFDSTSQWQRLTISVDSLAFDHKRIQKGRVDLVKEGLSPTWTSNFGSQTSKQALKLTSLIEKLKTSSLGKY